MKIHHSVTDKRVLQLVKARMTSLDNPGICVACGADHDECEPDARNYECHECGENMVYGADELMVQGMYRRVL